MKARVEQVADVPFNSVLLNLYRDGRDSVAWHSDDEPELGENPVIASVSFGAERRFQFKHKHNPDLRQTIDLTHGSLLLMRGTTQHFWKHQIPKTQKPCGARINLTFRTIISGD
jgi:alkylated DNA repair dioxygenase AlkB